MALRDGKSFLEGLRDGRTVYAGGEVVRDVTRHRPFAGILETLASLYDLQAASPAVLGFVSPESGELCPMPYRIPTERAHVLASQRAFELRANHTNGLLGRMPDFMGALVSDVARAQRRRPTLGARAENLIRYHALCSERDLCLTHTLIDPQIDRSKRPDELRDPDVVLRQVGETDAGIVVRGARMLSTLAPFADEIWVGPFHPRSPGEEALALCFAVPIATPGLRFVCREPFDTGRSRFDRPVSSRFDEEDALAIFADVVVPYERVFVAGDVAAYNSVLAGGADLAALQALTRGLVKLRTFVGLAARIADAIGRTEQAHHAARIGELAAWTEVLGGALRGGVEEICDGLETGLPSRALGTAMFVAMPEIQQRAVDVIRQLSGSGLVMTPAEADFDHPEIGPAVERFLQGRAAGGRERVRLFKLAWDLVAGDFGSRQALYEWFYAGDPQINRARFSRTPLVELYKGLVGPLLA